MQSRDQLHINHAAPAVLMTILAVALVIVTTSAAL
jgi:hypothetical protein